MPSMPEAAAGLLPPATGALDDQLALPDIAQPGDVVPVQGRVQLLADDGRGALHGLLARRQQVVEVLEGGRAIRDQDVGDPARTRAEVKKVTPVGLHGPAKVAQVPFAVAIDRAVRGDHDGLVARGMAALDQLSDIVAIAVEVDLHPGPEPLDGGNLFQRGRGDVAQHEGNVLPGCRRRQLEIPIARQHAVVTGRPDDQRHGMALAEYRRRQVSGVDPSQGPGMKQVIAEYCAVAM